MDGRVIRRSGRTLLVVGALAVAFGTVGSTLSPADVPVVEAADKDKKDDKKEKEKADKERDADRVAEGQVIEIDTLKDPPELILATADGNMVVRMLKTDEIAVQGVRLGDHVKVDGEKHHELLFEAQMLEVTERFSVASDDNGNDNKDKKKKKN
jgi:hypothetical protein